MFIDILNRKVYTQLTLPRKTPKVILGVTFTRLREEKKPKNAHGVYDDNNTLARCFQEYTFTELTNETHVDNCLRRLQECIDETQHFRARQYGTVRKMLKEEGLIVHAPSQHDIVLIDFKNRILYFDQSKIRTTLKYVMVHGQRYSKKEIQEGVLYQQLVTFKGYTNIRRSRNYHHPGINYAYVRFDSTKLDISSISSRGLHADADPVVATVEDPVVATVEDPVDASAEDSVNPTEEDSNDATVEDSDDAIFDNPVDATFDNPVNTPFDDSFNTTLDDSFNTTFDDSIDTSVEDYMEEDWFDTTAGSSAYTMLDEEDDTLARLCEEQP
eukprot:651471-Hanusia_phi.AAC.2